MEESQRCCNCLYSRTYEVIDVVSDELLNKYKEQLSLPEKNTITKCHFQGAPQRVNPKSDWCYQWNPM